MKMTSAYANKMLKALQEEKNFRTNLECESDTYTAAVGEEPVIPEYDYRAVSDEIAAIDRKIVTLKHAISRSNVLAEIPVGEEVLSVDQILVRMSMLNSRKAVLDRMRCRLPKARSSSSRYGVKNPVPEYICINYDLQQVRRDFDCVSMEITELQIALDRYNQTVEFDVDMEL